MYDYIAVINNDPAVTGKAFLFAFLPVLLSHFLQYGIGQCIEHAVAGAGAYHEVIGKRNDVFQVDQNDVFTLFIFEGVDDFTGKVECVQNSPLNVFSMVRTIALYKLSRWN